MLIFAYQRLKRFQLIVIGFIIIPTLISSLHAPMHYFVINFESALFIDYGRIVIFFYNKLFFK